MNSDRRTQATAALISPLLLLLALTLSATFGGPANADVSTAGSALPAPTVSEPLPAPTLLPAPISAAAPQQDRLADTGLGFPILVGVVTLLVCAGVLLLLGSRQVARARRLDNPDAADLD